MKSIAKWLLAAFLAALAAWVTDLFGFGLRKFLPSPQQLCQKAGLCSALAKDFSCSEPDRQVQVAPPGFDHGDTRYPQTMLHIDGDSYCDFCRTVGNEGQKQLWCTLGTAQGLVGETWKTGVFDPGCIGTAKWIDYLGVPAYSRAVGNSCEKRFVTPVGPHGFAPQVELAKE